MTKLIEVCDVQYGYPFDSKLFSESDGMPLIRIRDVVRGYSETFTTEDYKPEYVVHQGDILIGMDGEFNIAKWGGIPALLNQRVCRIFPQEEVDSDYIFHALPKALKEIENRTAFVTVKHLSAKEINKITIPIPPLEQQRQIAAILNTLQSIIVHRKQQLAKLDELVKARFVEMFGDPMTNPLNWKKDNAEHHIDLLSGYPFKSEQYVDSGVNICGGLIIMPQRIEWDSCVHWATTKGYEEYLLAKGDIVMALDRPWITEGFKIALVDGEHLPALLIQRTARIRATDINQKYLYHCFINGGFDKHTNITGSLVPHISAKDIKSFEIMLPPIDLQTQFAAFVEQNDKSKVAVQKALDEAQLLFDSLMQEYFG